MLPPAVDVDGDGDNDGDGWCNQGDEWPDCSNDPIDSDPYDLCGVCNGGTTGPETGYMDCNGECFGEAFEDECGICDENTENDNSSCSGCTDSNAENFDEKETPTIQILRDRTSTTYFRARTNIY